MTKIPITTKPPDEPPKELRAARSKAEITRVRQGYALIVLNTLVALKVFEVV